MTARSRQIEEVEQILCLRFSSFAETYYDDKVMVADDNTCESRHFTVLLDNLGPKRRSLSVVDSLMNTYSQVT